MREASTLLHELMHAVLGVLKGVTVPIQDPTRTEEHFVTLLSTGLITVFRLFGGPAFAAPDWLFPELGKANELAGDELSRDQIITAISRATGRTLSVATDLQKLADKSNFGVEGPISFCGWQADIPALRALYPPLMNFDTWLTQGGGGDDREALHRKESEVMSHVDQHGKIRGNAFRLTAPKLDALRVWPTSQFPVPAPNEVVVKMRAATLFTWERRPDAPPRCLPLAQSTRIHAQSLKLSKFGSLEPDNSDTFVS